MAWVIAVILVILLATGLFTVKQQTIAIVERFGRFKKASKAGLNFKIPLIDQIAGRVNLRVQQLDVQVETKTKDNVFVFVIVSVQYFVPAEKAVDAFYKLQNPQEQITAYVFDTVRARVPAVNLDQLFEMKDDIATAVKAELDTVMDDFGYAIVKAFLRQAAASSRVLYRYTSSSTGFLPPGAVNPTGQAKVGAGSRRKVKTSSMVSSRSGSRR
jgi:regulator of protease activity HflC (stomatin/prohibitin superfamily)